jgi:predicted dehydrogenase
MGQRTNRRRFLRTVAASATGCLILKSSESARSYQANEKLNIALIGVGERGRGFLRKVPQIGQNLVAVCDVDKRRIQPPGDLPAGIRVFRDFRQMLDELDDTLDAVIIATPHHSQAAISSAAIRRGKHVYCEKPIAQDVGEARDLRQLVGQHDVVTQMGNQGLASDSYRRVLELVQDGAIGEVREAHQWFISDYRRDPRDEHEPPADPAQVPDGLDWDLYLGPAAERPYHHEYMRWARWRDFGTGMLGMGGSHSCHMTFNALGLRSLWERSDGKRGSIRVEADFSPAQSVIGPDDALFPEWEIVRFDIPARGALPPARIHWYKGKRADLERLGVLQRMEKTAGRSLDWGNGWASESGTLVVGANGVVHTNMHNSECALLPLEKFPQQGGPPQRIPRSGSHEREWVNACRGRGPTPISNFDYAAPVLELLLLGNVCTRLNRPVEFDPVACKIVNDDEANAALRPPRRGGWPV